jgi:tyrosyl-tRNA synthetase
MSSNRFAPANEQMDEIRRDTLEIVPEGELARKVERSRRQGKPMVVKQGFDPTRPDLHLGHAVTLRKLRTFQELGHDVVFVMGDYTALIGDPTGRNDQRPPLTEEEVRENGLTYADQVHRVLDPERTRIEYNSSWLRPLQLKDLLELTAKYTVARMLERDDFSKRFNEGRPISVVEFMYPLMQGYDSVVLKADVELGGSDQKFNLLVARDLQERYGQEAQVCVLMPLLRGTDGVHKMSKSYDNYVGIADDPDRQYGRTLSIPDALLDEWWRLAAGIPSAGLERALAGVKENPYTSKRALAARVVELYHGAEAARAASDRFDQVFRRKEVPDDIPLHVVAADEPSLAVQDGQAALSRLLVRVGLASSNADAQRQIEQGAVQVDGEKVTARDARVAARGELVLQKGKRHFARVRWG